METFKMGEFFSGPGGMALGAHQAVERDPELRDRMSLQHAWAVDIDESSCLTYRRNIPGATLKSVKVGDARVAAENIDSFGDIDGFAFGFPCNDFSLVGEHKGLDGDFGGLYKTGVRVLEAKRPKWFVAENVGGIRSANGGRAFQVILEELKDAGYRITPHLYRFEQYGVPQARHRVLVVGVREDLDVEYAVPAPTHGPGTGYAFVTSGEVVAAPMDASVTNNERTRQSRQVVERLELIDPGENAFNAKRMTDQARLNVRGATISQIYRRLDPAKPSYTVTGSGGGGTHVYHWDEPRALTNRERARLQTFPDTFHFEGRRDSIRKQVGMAVPPLGAQAVFTALFRSLLGIPYESIAPTLTTARDSSSPQRLF
ncbi:DNA cytosine methyltransferase [Micrococcus luteus]|uniref:DNA cytosine methyltransferase n=1 Tax=Micrococcus TaxID=1269 RepID=UPI001E4FD0E1|nr:MULTISPECIES: DNA cytosine methyltransferase [Micrococcus]MCD0184649.1 DNA cytosine methyltransferase [Micrococcus luteus]MCO0633369.1 DNA cytosine methyltransferase [Micrococcus yunnanensis]MCT1815681.1 DNA cytosine methyltransferase [Micrococcus luteus]MCV7642996.1 DNA cytosine methyltransferase [Micrococcus luteus]